MQLYFLQPTGLVSIRNVTSIACQEKNKFGWTENDGYQVYSSETAEESNDVYFVLDTHNQNAFAHWVFENFVYLPLYFKVKKEFPSAKILIYEKKDYKYLFLEAYGVHPSDIVEAKDIDFQYQTLYKEPIQTNPVKPNLVFFHPYGSLNSDLVKTYQWEAILAFQKKIHSSPCEKTIPLLYLPRGEKENFASLDRRYVIQATCKDFVRSIGGTIFETDTNTDLQKQIELVRASKVILCDYGSNLWVNGFFSQGADIIFLNIGWMQEHTLPNYAILYSLISNQNKSMHNIRSYHTDESLQPSLVYHSFPQVKECIEKCLSN